MRRYFFRALYWLVYRSPEWIGERWDRWKKGKGA